jgi:hypothetical protein
MPASGALTAHGLIYPSIISTVAYCRATGTVTPNHKEYTMHQIIYIVGAVVIVLALLSFVGLR